MKRTGAILGITLLALVSYGVSIPVDDEQVDGSFSTTTPSPAESTTEDTSKKVLTLPNPTLCKSRPKHFEIDGHGYFYSGDEKTHEEDKLNWLECRNKCREYCMDLISIETPEENDMVVDLLKSRNIPYIWTSGRKCNFKGCERADLQPVNVNGWFWSGSGVKMAPTDSKPPGWSYQPWSNTGHESQFNDFDVPQPDNAEYKINESDEACMGVLNDIYQDGIMWHDIACYHTKPYMCEDSEQLLEYVRQTDPELKI